MFWEDAQVIRWTVLNKKNIWEHTWGSPNNQTVSILVFPLICSTYTKKALWGTEICFSSCSSLSWKSSTGRSSEIEITMGYPVLFSFSFWYPEQSVGRGCGNNCFNVIIKYHLEKENKCFHCITMTWNVCLFNSMSLLLHATYKFCATPKFCTRTWNVTYLRCPPAQKQQLRDSLVEYITMFRMSVVSPRFLSLFSLSESSAEPSPGSSFWRFFSSR